MVATVRVRIGALLALSLFVLSCGESQSIVEASGDVAEQRAGEVGLDREQVAQRNRVWMANRPPAFTYEVEVVCDCARAGTFTVTVDGEEVLGVERTDPDPEPYRLYPAPTIDDAFAMLDEPLALVEGGEIPHGTAAAAFDPTFGHPVSFTVVGSRGLGSYRVELREFRPLEPAVLDRSHFGFDLVVSNQSFGDPDVHLTVLVGDDVVVDRSFAVEGQHAFTAYRVPLEPGSYDVRVSADSGAVLERVVALGPERRHLYAAYWGDDGPGQLTLLESDQPFGFG